MSALYQQLFYVTVANQLSGADHEASLRAIVEGAPAEMVVKIALESPETKRTAKIWLRPLDPVWVPPGHFHFITAVTDAPLWRDWLDVLAASLPYYKRETRLKVISAVADRFQNGTSKSEIARTVSFLKSLTTEELEIIVQDNPVMLRDYDSLEPVPGLSESVRRDTYRYGATAGKKYASFAVLTAVRHDEEHLRELASLIFSEESLSGETTMILNGEKRKTRYGFMKHLRDGAAWWTEFDHTIATGLGWNELRYAQVWASGQNASPRPFLQEVLNRAIEYGIITPDAN